MLLALGCGALGLMLIGVALGGAAGASLAAIGQGALLALAAVFAFHLFMSWLRGGGD